MNPASRNRPGYSFFELICSLAAGTALVVGLASTMGVALKASSTTSTPDANTIAGLNILSEIAGDLTNAKALTEKTAFAVTATIPDRTDADTNNDSVQYSWSGILGNPLARRYNSGALVNVVPNVYDFSVEYYPTTGPAELLFVRIQISADPRTAFETTIPLLNRP